MVNHIDIGIHTHIYIYIWLSLLRRTIQGDEINTWRHDIHQLYLSTNHHHRPRIASQVKKQGSSKNVKTNVRMITVRMYKERHERYRSGAHTFSLSHTQSYIYISRRHSPIDKSKLVVQGSTVHHMCPSVCYASFIRSWYGSWPWLPYEEEESMGGEAANAFAS